MSSGHIDGGPTLRRLGHNRSGPRRLRGECDGNDAPCTLRHNSSPDSRRGVSCHQGDETGAEPLLVIDRPRFVGPPVSVSLEPAVPGSTWNKPDHVTDHLEGPGSGSAYHCEAVRDVTQPRSSPRRLTWHTRGHWRSWPPSRICHRRGCDSCSSRSSGCRRSRG